MYGIHIYDMHKLCDSSRLFCRSWLLFLWEVKASHYALLCCQGVLSEVEWLPLRHFYVSTGVATHWGIIFIFCQDRNHYQFVMFSFIWQTFLCIFGWAAVLAWSIADVWVLFSSILLFMQEKKKKEIWLYCKQCVWCLIIITRFYCLRRHLRKCSEEIWREMNNTKF